MVQHKLIELYFYVCQVYEEELRWHCQRFTKNGKEPDFTDCELLTTYLFAIGFQQRFQLKQIHRYIQEHWLDWFPQLPSYQSYCYRMNRMASCLPILVQELIGRMPQPNRDFHRFCLTDSMPIMTCSNKRRAKVARELCNKGYNSVKRRHFFGVKLHAISILSPGGLPLPEYLLISPASEHDLVAQRNILDRFNNRFIFGDKAFRDKKLVKALEKNGSELYTPVVYQDNIQRALRPMTQAADDLYSLTVSSIRQPIESWFNWIIEKTDIQRAAKVRSLKGLLVHIFGKIAAALLTLVI